MQSGTCTVTIKNVGSSNLVLTGTVAHDKCMDVWYISGSVAQLWAIEDLTINSLSAVCFVIIVITK
jgi:hypothetical protein